MPQCASTSTSADARPSHSYTRTGTLFHLPLPHPTLTLHLSITKLSLPSDFTTSLGQETSEPFIVQLQPSKPISGVPARGEMLVGEVIEQMWAVARRIDGLVWGTGRAEYVARKKK